MAAWRVCQMAQPPLFFLRSQMSGAIHTLHVKDRPIDLVPGKRERSVWRRKTNDCRSQLCGITNTVAALSIALQLCCVLCAVLCCLGMLACVDPDLLGVLGLLGVAMTKVCL